MAEDNEVVLDAEGNVVDDEEIEGPTAGAESGEETVADDDELDEASQKEAKHLYKLLKDPETRGKVIQMMAVQAGLDLRRDPIETKADVKEAKKDIKALVKEKLGPEYSVFAEKFGEVIEAVLEQERADNNEQVQELTLANVQTQVDSAMSRLNKETNGASKKLEHKIAQLVEKYPQPTGTSVYEYLKEMYVLAGGSKDTSSARITQRIQQSAKDATTRLRTKGSTTGVAPKDSAAPNKGKGLKGIVAAEYERLMNS